MNAVLETSDAAETPVADRRRAWLVFAVSFALLLSDYMSRQVLSAVFPQLKAEWALTDGQLGALGGVVALMVGLLTFPLSLVADRIGRVRSVAAMALTWSVASLACGLAANYGQMLAARLLLGVGEAAYGSVGLAVVFTYFPRSLRATITSAFMAGGLFGSFLGLTLGGAIAAHFGWRGAFQMMAVIGFGLVAVYAAVVRTRTATPEDGAPAVVEKLGARGVAAALFGSRKLVLTYLASGVQLFVLGSLMAWTPSYLNRAYGLEPATAAAAAAVLLLSSGLGMIVWGVVTDRTCAARPGRRPQLAAAYALTTFVFLQLALILPAGPAQIACALVGLFCAGATTGPAGAIVGDGTPPAVHGAALAVLTLSNNLLGLAPGPAVTGLLADSLGLKAALQIAGCAALLSAVGFALVGRIREADRASSS
ncbi:MFS transporter [Phenylobacterium sp. LjRoot219]|uniref:MFS transporter n=1 Tax=Phenylobacterium sp. LjRoot219 TaxID=3342283 RepID=UPI003ECF2741